MPFRLLSLISLFCLSAALYAQSEARTQSEAKPRSEAEPQAKPEHGYQIYGGYSYLSNTLDGVPGSHHGLSGFDAALATPPWRSVRFRIDFSSYSGNNLGAPQHPLYILGGAQYSHRIRRESVFAVGLIGTGAANKTWAANGAEGQTASFASVLGGGLDTPLTPRFALRAEAGYQYSYFVLIGGSNIPDYAPGLPRNFARVSTGLVWNF
jgi:hypothetical protein